MIRKLRDKHTHTHTHTHTYRELITSLQNIHAIHGMIKEKNFFFVFLLDFLTSVLLVAFQKQNKRKS